MLACDMGGMCGYMWLGWLAGLVILVAVIPIGIWLTRRSGQRSGGLDARRVLEERFARGEISAEEFEERRRVLESAR
jgi:putative membrane protein